MRHPLGRTVTATDNIWSSLMTVNTNPIHFDAHYASQTEFGRPLMNSCFTIALVTGLSVADVSRNAVNLGWDEVRMPAPLFEGDTVYAQSKVLSTRESKSRPTHGDRRDRDDRVQAGWDGRDDVPPDDPRLQARPRADASGAGA